VIGSIVAYLFAPDDPEAVIEKMAAPSIRIVSLTITEGGYNISDVTGEFDAANPDVVRDLAPGAVPRTTFGLITEALRRRRERGLVPFTVMSCDNLQGNGDLARRAFTTFARLRDPGLGGWVECKRCIGTADDDRPIDGPDSASLGLHDDAGVFQGVDECRRRAVEAGRLGCVQFDKAVVDVQAVERREHVFDQPDAEGRQADRCPSVGAGDLLDCGGNTRLRPHVGAYEHDPGRRRSRAKAQADVLAGEVTDAVDLGRLSDGPLNAIVDPFHSSSVLGSVIERVSRQIQGEPGA